VVTVLDSLGHVLEDDGGSTLTTAVTVGGVIEGSATAFGGDSAGLVEDAGETGAAESVDTTDDGDLGLSEDDGLEAVVDGDEGGGAGSIDSCARAHQVEVVGDTVGDTAVRGTDTHPGLYVGEVLKDELGVVIRVDTPEDGCVAAGQALGGDTRILQGLVRDLEGESLLRVHLLSLLGRDAEELGIKVF
jgi:hypothetical protein